ncbi:hypothetical protein Tsubulata_039950, partial [Turnera subulata]
MDSEPTSLYDLRQTTFKDREELRNIDYDIVLSQGYVTVIKKSKKDRYIIIGCDRGGSYRGNVSVESQKRNAATRLINCPF